MTVCRLCGIDTCKEKDRLWKAIPAGKNTCSKRQVFQKSTRILRGQERLHARQKRRHLRFRWRKRRRQDDCHQTHHRAFAHRQEHGRRDRGHDPSLHGAESHGVNLPHSPLARVEQMDVSDPDLHNLRIPLARRVQLHRIRTRTALPAGCGSCRHRRGSYRFH